MQSTSVELTFVLDRTLELTRRISDAKEKIITEKFQSITDIERNIENLQEAINQPHWENNDYINNQDMPYYALLAVQAKLISQTQFATLMQYWSATQLHEAEEIVSHSLFNHNGAVCNEASEILNENLVTTTGIGLTLTSDEYKDFIEAMQKLPPSEQQFFLVPDNIGEIKPITAYIQNANLFNVFGQVRQDKRIVPSLGMMQTYLDVKFKQQAVKINPVLGLSSDDDLRLNAFNSTRDVAFSFPGIDFKKADGYSALGYRFTGHDFFHSAFASCGSEEERELIAKTGDAIMSYAAKEKRQVISAHYPNNPAEIIYQYVEESDECTVHYIAGGLYDMPLLSYRPDLAHIQKEFDFQKEFDLQAMYWLTIAINFVQKRSGTPLSQEDDEVKQLPALKQETYAGILVKVFELAKEYKRTDILRSRFSEIKSLFSSQTTLVKEQKYPGFFSLGVLPELEQIAEIWWDKVEVYEILDQKIKPLFGKAQRLAEVKEIIKTQIEPHCTTRNILSIFQYAREHKIKILQQACMIFMAKNLNDLADQSGFKKLQEENPILADNIINHIRKSRFFKSAFKAALDAPAPCTALSLLMPSRANVNQLDVLGFTALDYAVEFGLEDLVLEFLELGADPNPQQDSKAMPTVFSALHHQQIAIADLLYEGFDFSIDCIQSIRICLNHISRKFENSIKFSSSLREAKTISSTTQFHLSLDELVNEIKFIKFIQQTKDEDFSEEERKRILSPSNETSLADKQKFMFRFFRSTIPPASFSLPGLKEQKVIKKFSNPAKRSIRSKTNSLLESCGLIPDIPQLRVMAKKGNPLGQFFLGMHYYHGTKVEKNLAEAARWFGCAAKQNYVEAQFLFGLIYIEGGEGVKQDLRQGIWWCKCAANQGHSDAALSLGINYLYGNYGIQLNYQQAVTWLQRVINRDSLAWTQPIAQAHLGWCYQIGAGVLQDLNRAVSLYHSSIEQGCAAGQYFLGKLDIAGAKEHQKNVDRGLKRLRLAIKQNDSMAQYYLGRLYLWGEEGIETNLPEAIRLLRLAAEQGNHDAQFELGKCYQEGRGVAADMNESLKWYKSAAQKGNVVAQNALKAYKNEATGLERPLCQSQSNALRHTGSPLVRVSGNLISSSASDCSIQNRMQPFG